MMVLTYPVLSMTENGGSLPKISKKQLKVKSEKSIG